MAPLRDGEHPMNSETTSILFFGVDGFAPNVSSSFSFPCLHITYSYGIKFIPSLTAVTRQHSEIT
ncbi:hypothetical protein HanIR_Chr17g0852451 [Helianthus annuus]|nr:hypothetical protein HanIR_Chr17g0852451 [Helianthus annuus]